jgi:hypothetical protein
VAIEPVLPDYAGACISNLVPALLGPGGTTALPPWLPAVVGDARQVVLFVLDGLGWEQLAERPALAPTLTGLAGGPITSVVPSTTATALTSISLGLAPGEHGLIGYRIDVHGDILNVLRWTTPQGDARRRLPPERLQPVPAYLGAAVPFVTKAELISSGFTAAHEAGAKQVGYRMPSTLVVEVGRLLAAGEPFVHAYYDGVDKVAHEFGLGEYYDAELRAADRLVGDLLGVLPPGAVLLITADHGQVDCRDAIVALGPAVAAATRSQSGEGRFRWLHARPGAARDLASAATEAHSGVSWVVTREQVVDEAWLGPRLGTAARQRLGDVALVARDPIAFDDPADTGPYTLVSRHGSLTPAEMYVPLLAGRNG